MATTQTQALQPLNQATGMQAVIQALQTAGFGKTSGGIVTHRDHGDFASWEAAAISCIEVAGN